MNTDIKDYERPFICTSCGYKGERKTVGGVELRAGPICQATCAFTPYPRIRKDDPTEFEFAMVVNTPKGEGVVIDQVLRGSPVVVAVGGVPYFFLVNEVSVAANA